MKFISACLIILLFQSCNPSTVKPGWPAITKETKPWTRWWWHGSALTKEGITAEMEAYQKAGLGGLEITPIYGVYGHEDKFVNYLSPEWMELLMHTLKEAERLDMGIDMATGTGWPFGGLWVSEEDACKNHYYKVYEVKGGNRLTEKIEFIQPPFLRAVGNQIYEVHENAEAEGREVAGTRKEPLMRFDPKAINIKQLVQPVAANKNLQALALDQVQFEKSLPLQVLMAYGSSGEVLNLIDKVESSGMLNWVAPIGEWKLYAVFEGWHGKMVERAGPGGEGNVIDHFSADALKRYLARFDSAFEGKDISSLRAFFNDSYEVDDARGAADWTPKLFDEFAKRRGYDLREHLPALFGHDEEEKNSRILCDYRETISELLLENFTQQWKEWAHQKSAIVRNQAHGSPANILDLYAVVDIPEIEGVDPLRIKMASSAGNVTGKKLISSESATWLNEHFESNLADIKIALDRFMLNGVNHSFYHGTSYSPPGEPWPGWLFYAAVHLNPRNPLWKDFDALNSYVTRCQSFLQNSRSDNDVLLYYPIYDRFSTRGSEMIEHFDGIGRQFENTAFELAAKEMLEKGYAFDFISDKQIERAKFENGYLVTEGSSRYQVLVIPHCQFIPISTLKKIESLAESGARVIFFQGLPEDVAGYANLENKKKEFDAITSKLKSGNSPVLISDNLSESLSGGRVRREAMVDAGIQFLRKKREDRTIYMINNSKSEEYGAWLPIQENTKSAVIYDPMSGEFGKAKTKNENGLNEVYVQLTSKQSLILEVYEQEVDIQDFRHWKKAGRPIALDGQWKIKFSDGGPDLPRSVETDSLTSWTEWGNEYEVFSGSAIYTLTFPQPAAEAQGWLLDLGAVKENAEVTLNGQLISTLIGPTYQVVLDKVLLKESNIFELRISNLMANRITHMDKRHVFWKKFYNVNFPARKAENRKNGLFDASHWEPRPSGLLGPVTLVPVDFE